MKRLHISLGVKTFETETSRADGIAALRVQLCAPPPQAELCVRVLRGAPDALLLVDDRLVSVHMEVSSAGRERTFVSGGARRRALLGALARPETSGGAAAPDARLTSPMPGRVVQVAVQAGELVEKGQLLLVIEAMKMQNELYSPASARVGAVHVNAGDKLERGALLLEFG